jgi:hypothetical protein
MGPCRHQSQHPHQLFLQICRTSPNPRRAMTRSSIRRIQGGRCQRFSSSALSAPEPAFSSAPNKMFCAVGHLSFDVPPDILPLQNFANRLVRSRRGRGPGVFLAALHFRKFRWQFCGADQSLLRRHHKCTVPAAGITGERVRCKPQGSREHHVLLPSVRPST